MIKKIIIIGIPIFFIFLITSAFINIFEKREQKITQLLKEETPKQFVIPPEIKVPEPNETYEDGIAVPNTVQEVLAGSTHKIRTFQLTAQNNTIFPNRIIVRQGDIVRVHFTAKDHEYDLVFNGFGVRQKANPGQTKMLEFQAVNAGSYTISCPSCNHDGGIKGLLLILPENT